jgi:hypothetical protein
MLPIIRFIGRFPNFNYKLVSFVVILSSCILYIVVWDPDRDFAHLRKDYTPASLRLCFSTSIFNFILRDTPFYFWSLCDAFILSDTGEEGDWMYGLVLTLLDVVTPLNDQLSHLFYLSTALHIVFSFSKRGQSRVTSFSVSFLLVVRSSFRYFK